jgi:hypothetical protein
VNITARMVRPWQAPTLLLMLTRVMASAPPSSPPAVRRAGRVETAPMIAAAMISALSAAIGPTPAPRESTAIGSIPPATPSQKALTYFKIIALCRRHQPPWSIHLERDVGALRFVDRTAGVGVGLPSAMEVGRHGPPGCNEAGQGGLIRQAGGGHRSLDAQSGRPFASNVCGRRFRHARSTHAAYSLQALGETRPR